MVSSGHSPIISQGRSVQTMRVLLHFSTHHTAREPPLSLVESGGREGRGEEAHDVTVVRTNIMGTTWITGWMDDCPEKWGMEGRMGTGVDRCKA